MQNFDHGHTVFIILFIVYFACSDTSSLQAVMWVVRFSFKVKVWWIRDHLYMFIECIFPNCILTIRLYYRALALFSKLLNRVTKSAHHALLPIPIVLFLQIQWMQYTLPTIVYYVWFIHQSKLVYGFWFLHLNEDLTSVRTGLKYCSRH